MYTVTKERDDYKEFIIDLDEDLETIDTKYLRPGSLAYCSGSGIHYVWGPDFKWYNKHTGYAYGEVEIITLPAWYRQFDEYLSPENGGHLYNGNEEIIPEEWDEETYSYGKFDLIFNNITFSVEEDSIAESVVAWGDNKIILSIIDYYNPYLSPYLEIIYDITTDTTVYRINHYLATEEQFLKVINAFKEYGKIEDSILFELYSYDPYEWNPEEYISDGELDYIISDYIDGYNDDPTPPGPGPS